jgi:hypothetical protein
MGNANLCRLADKIDSTMDLLLDELEAILINKVKNLSKNYPTRTFKVVSGHGGLSLDISRRSKNWNILTGRLDYFNLDYQDNNNTTPEGFAVDLFSEVKEMSTRFQDHFNGYACLQADFVVKDGEKLT